MNMHQAHRAPRAAFEAFALPTQPDGRRIALEAALERVEDLRQAMIAELDEIDGDPDLEPEPDEDNGDAEKEEGV